MTRVIGNCNDVLHACIHQQYNLFAGEGYICVVELYNSPEVWDTDIYMEGSSNRVHKFGDGNAGKALPALTTRMREPLWLIRGYRPE